jgi:phosphomevalonate kinase
MRVLSPGKLVLTGAYAVLRGAPAIVAAVDRHAVARGDDPERPDASALHDGAGRKLGLGSSAASIVAGLGARALAQGDDLRDPVVRERLFCAARDLHARSQGGGSGVDVAAAVYGGVLRYELRGRGAPVVRAVELPPGVVWRAFFSGSSARTSELIARVDSLCSRNAAALGDLFVLAHTAAAAVEAADSGAFVLASREYGAALDALGRAADAPIVPAGFAELASIAAAEGGAFLPSGAGGGDVGLWVSRAAPSEAFLARSRSLGMTALSLGLDREGVRPLSLSRES